MNKYKKNFFYDTAVLTFIFGTFIWGSINVIGSRKETHFSTWDVVSSILLVAGMIWIAISAGINWARWRR